MGLQGRDTSAPPVVGFELDLPCLTNPIVLLLMCCLLLALWHTLYQSLAYGKQTLFSATAPASACRRWSGYCATVLLSTGLLVWLLQ